MRTRPTKWIALYPLLLTALMIILQVIETGQAPPAAGLDFSLADTAVRYWSQAPAVIGLNHGLAGMALLLFGLVPYGIWLRTGKERTPASHLGVAAGTLYGIIHGVSLVLQAAACPTRSTAWPFSSRDSGCLPTARCSRRPATESSVRRPRCWGCWA